MSDRRRYPGVQSFEEADSGRFFGRKVATDALLMRVLSVRLLLQFAPSGAGKTSLLNAGLFPRLRPRGYLPFSVRLNEPTETLIAAVTRSLRDAATRGGLRDPVIPDDATSLWDLLARVRLFSPQLVLLTPVIVFDQFEEVFTLRDAAFREGFAHEVGELTRGRKAHAAEENSPEVKVIISLREEYLGVLEEMSTAIPDLFRERMRLVPLTGEEAREAMVEPALLPGDWCSPRFRFERACLDQLIDFIDGVSERVHVIETLTLQLVCERAEEIAKKKGGDLPELVLADFGGVGGLDDLVSHYYQAVLASLPGHATRKKAREMFEQGLLDASGKRRMLEQEDILRRYGLGAETLDELTRRRLLRREPRNESTFFEISHDRLTDVIAKQRTLPVPGWARMALGVAAAVIASLLVAIYWVRAANLKAESSRKKASEALAVLFGDELTYRMRDAGESATLQEVLDNAPADPTDDVYTRVHQMRIRAELAWERQTLEQTEDIANLALHESDKAGKSSNSEARMLGERMKLLQIRGDVFVDRDQLSRGEAAYQQALLAWNSIAAQERTPMMRLNAADLRIRIATLLVRIGNPVRAETVYVDAANDALEVLTAAYRDTFASEKADYFLLGRALQLYSTSTGGLAGIWQNIAGHKHARALAAESVRLRPFSAWSRAQLGYTSANLASAVYIDQRKIVAPYFEESQQQFAALDQSDPHNRRMQRERAAVEMLTAEIISMCAEAKECSSSLSPDRVESAESQALDASGRFQDLANQDPQSRSLRGDLAWGKQVHARLRAVQNHPDQALALIDQALKLLAHEQGDPRDAGTATFRVDLQVMKARYEAARGRPQQSASAFDSAVAAAEKVPGELARVWPLAEALGAKAEDLRARKQVAEAAALDARITELWKPVNAAADARTQATSTLGGQAINLYHAAESLAGEASVTKFQSAADLFRKAIARSPDDPNRLAWLGSTCTAVAGASRSLESGKADETNALEPALRCAHEYAWLAWVMADDLEAVADRTGDLQKLVDSRKYLAMHLRDVPGRIEEALALADQNVRDAESLMKGAPTADMLALLADSYYGLGLMREESNHSGWEQPIRAALQRGHQLHELEPQVVRHPTWLGQVHRNLSALLEKHAMPGVDSELKLAEQACTRATGLAKTADDQKLAGECTEGTGLYP